MEEIWKDLPESEDYEVSNTGRVRSKNTGSDLTLRDTRGDGRLYFEFRYENGLGGKDKKTKSIHRAVAEAFLEKDDENADRVVHIDGDYANNSVDNLLWVTASELARHAATSNPGAAWETRRERYGNSGGNTGRKKKD